MNSIEWVSEERDARKAGNPDTPMTRMGRHIPEFLPSSHRDQALFSTASEMPEALVLDSVPSVSLLVPMGFDRRTTLVLLRQSSRRSPPGVLRCRCPDSNQRCGINYVDRTSTLETVNDHGCRFVETCQCAS